MSYALEQYEGDGSNTNFTVPFPYLAESHVKVFVDGVAQTLDTDFSFLNATTIQFVDAPEVDAVVLLRRESNREERLVDHEDASTVTEATLDADANQVFFVAQEAFDVAEDSIQLADDGTYDADSRRIKDVDDPEDDQDAATKAYGDANWGGASVIAAAARAAEAEASADAAAASATAADASADAAAASATAADASADAAEAAEAATEALVESVWETGDAKVSIRSTASVGWVVMNDGTMGNAASGGTARANADTEDLFTLLWNSTADANCAVSGGRGASAAADFAANKTIALPKVLGRALAVAGSGSGLTARALAVALGSENAVVVEHNHGVNDPGHVHPIQGYNDTGGGGGPRGADVTPAVVWNTQSAVTNVTIQNSGESGTGKNMQPTSFAFHVHVKL